MWQKSTWWHMDRDHILWRAYHGGTYLGMVSLVAVVTRPRHSGKRVSTYVARKFALRKGVHITVEWWSWWMATGMVCCQGRQRFQVEEDVRSPSCARLSTERTGACTQWARPTTVQSAVDDTCVTSGATSSWVYCENNVTIWRRGWWLIRTENGTLHYGGRR